jgi:6-phosphofructokinase
MRIALSTGGGDAPGLNAVIRAVLSACNRGWEVLGIKKGYAGLMGEEEVIPMPGQAIRVGGVAERLAGEIEEHTGKETRSLILGHLQRGGQPTSYDRLLAVRFGGAAVRAVAEEKWDHMIALQSPHIVTVPLDEVLKIPKRVELDHDTVLTARATGISFGD